MTTVGGGRQPTRALVLGGGGVTGIAWEVGLLHGLSSVGVDLSNADAVFGTSAGAFVGAELAGGVDPVALYARQQGPSEEIAVSASDEAVTGWIDAFVRGGDDREAIGRALGEVARSQTPSISAAERRQAVVARLTVDAWPTNLHVTAIDADSGALHAFSLESGVELVEALSASGAVPGVWPLQHIAGHDWIDGGMVSSANALLAAGFDRIVVVAPMPGGLAPIPGAADDVATLGRTSEAMLIAPDEASAEAIGPNIYDPGRRSDVAAAGMRQGLACAASVAAAWG